MLYGGNGPFGNAMKIYLQHQKSRQFLMKNWDWTPDIEKAMNFSTSLQAMDFCRLHKLGQTQVVLKFGDPRYDIVLQPHSGQSQHPSQNKRL